MRYYAPNEVVGYTGDATMMCVECAIDQYGVAYPEVQEVFIPDGTMDREGNQVHPVYEWDEDANDRCMECGEWLIEPYTDPAELERDYLESQLRADMIEAGLYDAERTRHLWDTEHESEV